MGDTEKPKTLEDRVAALEDDAKKEKVLGHDYTEVKKEITKIASDHTVLKGEVTALHGSWDLFAIAFPGLVISITLPALFSLEPVIERVLEKKFHITRAKSGFLSYTRKAKRDARAAAERLESADHKIGLLKEQMLEKFRQSNQRVHNAEQRIGNSNIRINRLEQRVSEMDRKVRRIDRWADGVRAGVRNMSSAPELQGVTNRVTALQRQVNLLSSALA
ncbi:hypothetical protein [Streptomyces sp. NPDC018711]|uniref:hypothetical protein n=1 Tax=Streptomyces sp. NPDC018711 TaxID=3365052 RepID=UPI00379D099E